MKSTRREMLAGLGALSLATFTVQQSLGQGVAASCPFRLAVINDEITQDFELACKIASQDFGLHWIEMRGMWDKNVTELSPKQIDDSLKILAEHKLRVTDIASPLFKTDWPGAPRSDQSENRDQFHADFDASAQDKLLEHCISLAKTFHTDRIRCFDYWRLADQKPYRAAINAKLRQAAERCAKEKLILLLENEMSCNTATGEEAAEVLKAIPNSNFMLNWESGQCGRAGRHALPERIRCSAQEPDRTLPCKRRHPAGGRKIRLGAGGRGGSRLGWTIQGVRPRRLPLRREFGNPLARRRHAGSLNANQHGGAEESDGQGRGELLSHWQVLIFFAPFASSFAFFAVEGFVLHARESA